MVAAGVIRRNVKWNAVILPAPLWTLIRLQRKARYRRLLRGARTIRGAALLVLGFGAMSLWIAPSLTLAFTQPRTDGSRVHLFLPLSMLGLCAMNVLSSAGERAIAFMPAEADFLFPGPFTRRQLLGYKLMQNVIGTAIASIFFSLLWLRHSRYWIDSWSGYFLAMTFVQLLSMAAVLIAQSIGERAAARGKRVLMALLAVAIYVAIKPYLSQLHDVELPMLFDQIRASTVGRALFAPFDVFATIITAKSFFPEAITSIGIALAMIGALLAIVLWLDVQYTEMAAAAGVKLHAKLSRMRRGGGLTSGGPSAKIAWLHLPMPPRLAGIGPIAWRQTVSAMRQSRGVFIFVGIICVVGMIALSIGKSDDQTIQIIGGGLFWITIVLVESLRFDFRGDVDRMDTLRALPIANTAITVAQLVAPTAVLMACHTLIFSFGVITKKLSPMTLPLGLLVALPIDLLIVEIENLIFLIFPSRRPEGAAGDMQGVGRRLIGLISKLTALSVILGIAALIGFGFTYLMPDVPQAGIISGAVVALVEAISLIPLLTFAFSRFDPSSDTPIG